MKKKVNEHLREKGIHPEKELTITLDPLSLKDQTDRLVTELGLTKVEAETISKGVANQVKAEVDKQGKDWSIVVEEMFTNLMIATFIEMLKADEIQLNKEKRNENLKRTEL